MASNSFKVKNSLVLTPKDLATLVSPEAGDLACDINDSNKIKRYDANASAWVEVGSGGGVGGTDIFFVQDFESASLASFTQTGLTLSQTDPLHGRVSALLTHQAAVNQSFKQIIPVDRKFRGESMTLRLNAKSNASASNVTIKIYDETNAANIVASEQLELANDVSGAISQVGFTIPATCASISYTITALPQSGSPVTRIDDIIAELAVTSLLETVVELTGNAQTLTIPLTQSGLVQEGDSEMLLIGGTVAAAANSIATGFSVSKSTGSALLSATNRVTALVAGQYSIAISADSNSATALQLFVNGTAYSAHYTYAAVAAAQRIPLTQTVTLKVNDYVEVRQIGSTAATSVALSIARQGSLKQVSVNTNSKITIPTSELRFEGASTRGTGSDSTIVKFDTMAKIRGDAFTVVNDAALGTVITITKAGKLDIGSNLNFGAVSAYIAISKNQAIRTTTPTSSEIMTGEFSSGTNDTYSVSWSGFVNIGDVFRIHSSANPSANVGNNLNLSFQEQEIQVSVSNTLPQFSESDSCVRLTGANGYGSTATTTRRFASVVQNLGTDIEYTDSPTLGGRFIAKASGIYNVSYTELSNANTPVMFIIVRLNGANVAIDNQVYNTASTGLKAASTSWQGYLSTGDIITAAVDSSSDNNGNTCEFTISKVGKPNVTGVNVTPFVNVPQPVSQSSFLTLGTTAPDIVVIGAPQIITGSGIFSYSASTGIYTALKTCTMNISASSTASTVSPTQVVIVRNSLTVSVGNSGSAGGGYGGSCSWDGIAQTGDTFYIGTQGSGTSNAINIEVLATASADTILTAPETFSTDTASLQYAPSSTYTLSTLANAPVGTYITYTYAASGNVRTQTTTAPTQTTADMNANGILLYTRAFNAASTAAQPAAIAIQIGKGLKGKSLDLYKSAGKVTAGSLDYVVINSATEVGALYKDYNEITGILLVDMGVNSNTSTTAKTISYSDLLAQTSGYLVINASKNPSLTGMNIERVSASGRNSSGQSIPSNTATTMVYDATKRFDTNGALNAATGIFTCPETGYYQVSAGATFTALTPTAVNNIFTIQLYKNGTASTVLGYLFVETVTTAGRAVRGAEIISLNKGDTLSLSVFHNTTGAKTLTAAVEENYFSITKTNIGGKS